MLLFLTADCTPLADSDALSRALTLLPPRRQEQLFLRAPDGQAQGAGAWLLLLEAARRLGVSLPPEISLSAHGKPFFPALPDFSFSLSHTKGRCLCAASDFGEKLGCDLEELRPLPHWKRLARRFFHPGEARWLLSQPDPETEFFRLWTEKEAVLKAAGTGFSQGMRHFSLRGTGQGGPLGLPPVFSCRSAVREGYAVALCREEPLLPPPEQVCLTEILRARAL